MSIVTFNFPLEWNPFSAGGFEPADLITDPTVTVITNTATEWVIEKTIAVDGFGNVPVRLTLRPIEGGSLTPGAGLPGGVIDSILVQANAFGNLITIGSISAMSSLGLQASQITSGSVLFTGPDQFSGSTGDDLFNAGGGDDELLGNGGADVLLAGGGADDVSGGAGDDVLSGDGVGVTGDGPAGADVLNGGAGADALYGGGEGDTFVIASAADSAFGYDSGTGRFLGDVIYDFVTTQDQIDLTDVTGDVITAVVGGSTFVYLDSDGDGLAESGEGMVVVYNANVSGAGLLIGDRGLTMYGSSGADTLNGTEQSDVIVGGAGSDSLAGEGGSDFIYLGAGDGAGDTVAIGADDSIYSLTEPTLSRPDYIIDFEAGIDTISFAGIDGQNTLLIQTIGDDSFVYVDLAGDGTWDIAVIVVDEIITEADIDMGGAGVTPPPGKNDALVLPPVEPEAYGPDVTWDLAGHRLFDAALGDGGRGWLV